MAVTYPLLELWLRPEERSSDGAAWSRESQRKERALHLVDDVTLVDRIRAGDQTALGLLYEATFHDLWVFARRYVGDALAEEVVQDVFLWLWTNRTWKIHSTVHAYLFGAVRHRALNIVHRESIETRAAEIIVRDANDALTEVTSAAETTDQQGVRAAIVQAIATFPERQRAAIILRIDRELSYSEIGEALGISATAAGNLVKKGEEKLRTALKAYEPDRE